VADKIRVLLADDHPALRMGLGVLLNRVPELAVVGEAESGEAALALLETLAPDVAVLDCQLPGLEGAAVAATARQRGWPVRILALSAYDDDRYLYEMWAAGAVGYLLKNEAPGQIVAAVLAAARGASLWSAEQERRARRWQAEVARLRASLTDREREVLLQMVAGLSNKEIAVALGVTERTVEFHVGNILRKLGVISRVEAAVWASVHMKDGHS
jgi:DNA-binding NarL/FixJ family response regulator